MAMESGRTEATPDLEDVLQELPAMVTVPVKVEGQVLAHELPAKRVQTATDVIPAATWTPLLPETPKRKRTVLLSTDKPFYVSQTGAGSGMLWPANVPLEWRGVAKVYVMSADAALPATLSHMSELWAD
jgi:hypothetical protein